MRGVGEAHISYTRPPGASFPAFTASPEHLALGPRERKPKCSVSDTEDNFECHFPM